MKFCWPLLIQTFGISNLLNGNKIYLWLLKCFYRVVVQLRYVFFKLILWRIWERNIKKQKVIWTATQKKNIFNDGYWNSWTFYYHTVVRISAYLYLAQSKWLLNNTEIWGKIGLPGKGHFCKPSLYMRARSKTRRNHVVTSKLWFSSFSFLFSFFLGFSF